MKRTTLKIEKTKEIVEVITMKISIYPEALLDGLQDYLVANYDVACIVSNTSLCWTARILDIIEQFNIKSNNYFLELTDLDDYESEEIITVYEKRLTCKSITR
jgi:lipopolysaccharide biosynthesis glycosyltransferase